MKLSCLVRSVLRLGILFTICTFSTVSANIVIAGRCKNGIVVACDKSPLAFEKSKSVLRPLASGKTIFHLSDDIAIAVLEGTAKFHSLFRDLQRFVREYDLENDGGFSAVLSTSGAENSLDIYNIAKYARRLIYQKYPREHIVLAGYSQRLESFCLYEVMQQGSLFSCDYVIGGSGGKIAHSILDYSYQQYSAKNDLRESSSFDPFSNCVSDFDRGKLAVGTSSQKISGDIDDIVSVVQKAIRISSSFDQHCSMNNMELWLLRFEQQSTSQSKKSLKPLWSKIHHRSFTSN